MSVFSDIASVALTRALMEVSQGLNDSDADRLGAWLGRRAMTALSRRAKIAEDNLSRAFGPAKSASEISAITEAVFENMGRTFVETLRFPIFGGDEVRRRISMDNAAAFAEGFALGRGCVGVTAHFDSWDFLGAWLAGQERPSWSLAAEQSNTRFNTLLNTLRESVGVRVIQSSDRFSGRRILEALARNEIVNFVADQHAASGHVEVNFFGQPVAAVRGPALFAYRANAPIILAFSRRIGPSRHAGWVEETMMPNLERPEGEEIQRLTQAIFVCFERVIRREPELWMWTHRRWKPVPNAPNESKGKVS